MTADDRFVTSLRLPRSLYENLRKRYRSSQRSQLTPVSFNAWLVERLAESLQKRAE